MSLELSFLSLLTHGCVVSLSLIVTYVGMIFFSV
jgi:hypothetical protein